MADREPKKTEPGNNRLSRMSRTASFWVLLALLSILAMQMFRGQQEASSEFSYSQFKEQLAAGNIDSVVVVQGNRLEGELRSPVIRGGGETVKFRTMLPGEIQESLLARMEEQGVIISAEPDRQGLGTVLISILPWLLFIAFWIWIFRTMQGGGNKAFQFGRSKAKLISPDKPQVTFADVAGADEAKVELQEIIEFLKDPHEFSRLGGRLAQGRPPGGPPGNGEDPAGQGCRGGSRAALLPDVGVGLRGDVRGRRGLSGQGPLRPGEGPRPLHHLRGRDRCRGTAPRRRPWRRARRAGADAECPPGGDGRVRDQRRGHPPGRHEPARTCWIRPSSGRGVSTVRSWWTSPT